MRNQTAREPKFPAACARCGGRISEPVTFCPHCGAHARFALAGEAPRAGEAVHAGRPLQPPHGAAASARAEPKVPPYDFEGDLDPPWPGPPTPLFASPDGDPYGEVHAPDFRGDRQWGLKGGTVLVVAAFVVLYGGAVAVHRYDSASPLSPPSASKSADGAIAPTGGGDGNVAAPSGNAQLSSGSGSSSNALQPPAPAVGSAAPSNASPPTHSTSTSVATNNSVGSGAPAAPEPAPPAPNADAARAPDTSVASLPPSSTTMQAPPTAAPTPTAPQAQPDSARDSRADATARGRAQSVQPRSGLGDTATAGTQPERQPYRSPSRRDGAAYGQAAAARALDSAQAQLAKSDLRGARASLARALAADPNNGEALSLRGQLLAREQDRDASLTAAHACVVQARWNCVWHNAGKALSVDASSGEAKALVDRAIVESGAATAPAGPGPDNVEVPMVQ